MVSNYILNELQWRLNNPAIINFSHKNTQYILKSILLELTDNNQVIDEYIQRLCEQDALQKTITNPKTGEEVKIATALQFDPNGDNAELYNLANAELERLNKKKKNDDEFAKNKQNKNIKTVGDQQYDTNFMSDGEIAHIDDKIADEKLDTQNKESNILFKKKDKTLIAIDTLSTPAFTESIKPSTDEFNKLGIALNEPQFSFEDIEFKNIPVKYIQLLSRMINYDAKNKKMHQINNLITNGGAGDIQSQAGELMTIVLCSLPKDQAEKLAANLINHIKSCGNNSILTSDWVISANNCAESIRNRIAKQYGKYAEINAIAWDIQQDVESLGLQDYKQNKGFSSDMYIKIKIGDKFILDEPSLKKDESVMLYNGSIGDFKNYTDELPDNINVKAFNEKRKQLMDELMKTNGETISGNIRLMDLNSDEANEGIDAMAKGNKKIDVYKQELKQYFKKLQDYLITDPDATFTRELLASSKLLGKVNQKGKEIPLGDQRSLNKHLLQAIQISAHLGDLKSQKFLDTHFTASKVLAKNATLAIANNKDIKLGVINSIRENLPIKTIADGEESMHIGALSLDKFTLLHMFGTDDYNRISDSLVIGGNDENPTINYIADVEGIKRNIIIANIKIREDGMGYGGIFKFEMQLNSDFSTNLYKAHKEIYGANTVNQRDTKKFEQRIKNQQE